jgi:dephospho-CoA kinase
LLVETGQADRFEQVLVVDVPPEIQLHRLMNARSMSEDEARARIASQASREDRLAAADLVVDNSGTLADLDRRINEIWSALTATEQ